MDFFAFRHCGCFSSDPTFPGHQDVSCLITRLQHPKPRSAARSIPAMGCSIDGSSSYSLSVSRSAQMLQEICLEERIGERVGASKRCGGDVTFAFDRWLHTAQFSTRQLEAFHPTGYPLDGHWICMTYQGVEEKAHRDSCACRKSTGRRPPADCSGSRQEQNRHLRWMRDMF